MDVLLEMVLVLQREVGVVQLGVVLIFVGFEELQVVLLGLVEILELEVEGFLVEHIVLQEWMGVQGGVVGRCKIGYCVEKLVILDLLVG